MSYTLNTPARRMLLSCPRCDWRLELQMVLTDVKPEGKHYTQQMWIFPALPQSRCQNADCRYKHITKQIVRLRDGRIPVTVKENN